MTKRERYRASTLESVALSNETLKIPLDVMPDEKSRKQLDFIQEMARASLTMSKVVIHSLEQASEEMTETIPNELLYESEKANREHRNMLDVLYQKLPHAAPAN